ncbi:hypothetical protein L596_000973 [Steinernema carpocapsae]|uniref:Uncharacterized protein n=1 Tax=Steinernema carpocapsae TaxID=34508 RepID=A0A4U8UK89_STECR|nr:hypothetical protein L596_000973 [Steinernema carpocapsae]
MLPLAAFSQRSWLPLHHQEAPRQKQPTTPKVCEALHPVTTLRPQPKRPPTTTTSAALREDSRRILQLQDRQRPLARIGFLFAAAAPIWRCCCAVVHIILCVF